MKKFAALFLTGLLTAALAGCGPADAASTDDKTGTETTAAITATDETTTEVATEEMTTEVTTVEETEPLPQVIGWNMQEPDWFVKTSETEDMVIWMNPKMTEEPSNIILSIAPRDASILNMSADDFLAEMSPSADEGSMVVNAVSVVEVDGYPTLYADYDFTTSGIATHAEAYFVVASETYVFMFCDCSADGRWQEDYAKAAASIDLLHEGEYAQVDTSSLALYDDLRQGINLYAEADLTSKDLQGIAAYLTNSVFAIQVDFDMNTKHLSAVEYYEQNYRPMADYYPELTYDKYGNLCGSYTYQNNSGTTLYSYITVKENNGHLYVLRMFCFQDLAQYYAEQFPRWAATVTFDEDAP